MLSDLMCAGDRHDRGLAQPVPRDPACKTRGLPFEDYNTYTDPARFKSQLQGDWLQQLLTDCPFARGEPKWPEKQLGMAIEKR
jgi:hypothetical protein